MPGDCTLLAMQRTVLLGVPFDRVTMREAVARMVALLDGDAQSHVMTPNAEMLVAASRDPGFRDVLCRAALNVADGIGVVWCSRLLGQPLPERVAGVDLVQQVCASLAPGHSVFFLGAAPGVAERAAAALAARFPQITIAGTASGSPSDVDAPVLLEQIRSSGASLLLVAYGAPAQDVWIDRHAAALPSVRVAMGVGGTFDFLAGVRRRAPRWMQRCGLEWFWRLLCEPRRIGRMFTAVIVFPLLVLRHGRSAPAARI